MSNDFDGTLSSVPRAEAVKRLRTNEALEEALEKANKDIQVLAEALSEISKEMHRMGGGINAITYETELADKYKELANKHLKEGGV
ncbi:MAG: hypothetical protein KAR06_03895 [Deltaproteobacteria bacterium]|nr:hypothetical protein [Deltaproteobacteria bacterium]